MPCCSLTSAVPLNHLYYPSRYWNHPLSSSTSLFLYGDYQILHYDLQQTQTTCLVKIHRRDDDILQTMIGSSATNHSKHDNNFNEKMDTSPFLYYYGLRSGKLFQMDLRIPNIHNSSSSQYIGCMDYCVESMQTLDDHQLIVRDIVGNIARWDLRNTSLLSSTTSSVTSASTSSSSKFSKSYSREMLLDAVSLTSSVTISPSKGFAMSTDKQLLFAPMPSKSISIPTTSISSSSNSIPPIETSIGPQIGVIPTSSAGCWSTTMQAQYQSPAVQRCNNNTPHNRYSYCDRELLLPTTLTLNALPSSASPSSIIFPTIINHPAPRFPWEDERIVIQQSTLFLQVNELGRM